MIAPDDLRRLRSSLNLLTSESDGEKLAAVAAVSRILAKVGANFADLADALPVHASAVAALTRSERVRPRQWWPDNETEHQRLARVLLQTGHSWSEWELGFLKSAASRERPSAKERSKLEQLRTAFWNRAEAA